MLKKITFFIFLFSLSINICGQTSSDCNGQITWYADFDNDGFGDLNDIIISPCPAPANYITNCYFDDCPTIAGTRGNGCPQISYNFDNDNQNYIYERLYLNKFEPEVLTNATNTDVIEQISYVDGLGRLKQQNSIGYSPLGNDIIVHHKFDGNGEQKKSFLPYVSSTTNGLFDINSEANTLNYYNTSQFEFTTNPYAEIVSESSPLNRILEQGAPGVDWLVNPNSDTDHTIKYDYQTNIVDEVSKFEVIFTTGNIEEPQLFYNGNYNANSLYKTVTKDENWNPNQTNLNDLTTEEFKDKQGRVVLKRVYNGNISHDTNYVYDDFGNLTYVLSPEGTDKILDINNNVVQSILDGLCYQYIYDYKNRPVEKKISGKDWEYIVYDQLDRPVFTQDVNLRINDNWLFTKYDAFGRVTYTGMMLVQNEDRKSLQALVDSQTIINETATTGAAYIQGWSIYYTNQALNFPNSAINIVEVYSINYYDTYNPDLSSTFPNPNTVFSTTVSSNTKSLPTGSKVYVLDKAQWITTVNYYDNKGRAIYTGSKNDYLNTTDILESDLDDFTGRVIQTKSTHTKGTNAAIIITDDFTYDHVNRLLSQTQTIAGQAPELITNNNYDELGQLASKDVGSSLNTPLQSVDYRYNVRGWLKEINDVNSLGTDLFSFKLGYNTHETGYEYSGTTDLYNGNISQTIWKTTNDALYSHSYAYQYDALNRMLKADFDHNDFSSIEHIRNDTENISYDKNGNIITLDRPLTGGSGWVAPTYQDLLQYTYDGNQLLKVDDLATGKKAAMGLTDRNKSGNDYAYDANGNMTKDLNKDILNITYNHLNLPVLITQQYGNIQYIYDALGNKLEKIDDKNFLAMFTTRYAGNYIYEEIENGSGESLKFFNHPEGYVEPDGSGGFDYVYQYKDHLGNIRLSYADRDGNYQEILNSNFTNAFDGWIQNGSVNYSLESGRLKANVDSAWEGVKHELTGLTTAPGETFNIKLTFDKGNTQSSVRIYFQELDTNGNHLRYAVFDSNVSTGSHEYSYTIVEGTRLRFRIDKDNTNTNSETYFYIDHVSLTRGALEIVEENNYFPFGLKHTDYNNVVSANANSVAGKFKFNGIEFEKSLSINLYEMDVRSYDPAIGRFTSIDPVTHFNYSTYTAFDNNPIFFADPSGADSDGYYDQYDLEWGGYMSQPDDPDYSDEGQVYGWFMFGGGSTQLDEIEINVKYTGWRKDDSYLDDFDRHEDDIIEVDQSQIDDWVSKFRLQQEHDRWMLQYGTSPYVDINSPMEAIGNFAEWGTLVTAPALAAKATTTTKASPEGFKSLGAAGKNFSKVLQSGGQSLKPSTLRALKLSKEQGRNAIHALKSDIGLPNNFHGKIMGNGDYLNPSTGKWLGNLFDYIF
jgi:RHS repeat-associated protein